MSHLAEVVCFAGGTDAARPMGIFCIFMTIRYHKVVRSSSIGGIIAPI